MRAHNLTHLENLVCIHVNVGVYGYTYFATDDENNVQECSWTVTVEDKVAPVITCPVDAVFRAPTPDCIGFYDMVGGCQFSV